MNIEQTKTDCWGYRFHTYGTIRLFEKRAQFLQTCRTWITFLGVVVPVIIGSIVLSFGAEASNRYVLGAAGVVITIQLVLSTWSIVARWDEKYEYAMKSSRDNTRLYNDWNNYDKRQLNDSKESEEIFNQLKQDTEKQEFSDIGQNISEKEKRFANRAALFYFKQECHVCNKIPNTMKPSKCSGCGNF